jgi:MFS family permease
MPLLVQDTFGLKSFGTIFGVIQFVSLGAALSGPLFAGVSFDATGSYRLAFGVLAVLFVGAAFIVSLARPPERPRVDEAPLATQAPAA